jgi:hypothetical protein
MTVKVDDIDDEQGGFDFDRSGTIQETVDTNTKTNTKKNAEENDSGSSSDVDINDI